MIDPNHCLFLGVAKHDLKVYEVGYYQQALSHEDSFI